MERGIKMIFRGKAVVTLLLSLLVIFCITSCTRKLEFEDDLEVDLKVEIQNMEELIKTVSGIAPEPPPDEPPRSCLDATPSDADCDGFSDSLEARGFTTVGGTRVRPCTNNEAIGTTQRASCLDSRYPDLFVVLEPHNSSSLIPTSVPGDPLYPFGNIAKPVSEGGFGITIHEINKNDWSPTNHRVTPSSSQVAAYIHESWAGTLAPFDASCQASEEDVANIILGETTPPKVNANTFVYPHKDRKSFVYPLRIIGYIDYKCEEAGGTSSLCKDSITQTVGGKTCGLNANPTNIVADSLDKLYIEHIIAHELGHQINLTKLSKGKLGWHHSVGSDNEIMTKTVDIESGAVFQIDDKFCSECLAFWVLHQY